MPRDNQAWLTDLQSEGAAREEALAELRARLLRVLPPALSRYLASHEGHFDAFLEDVAQETLLRVLERLDTFAGRSKFTTWVYTIAIRIAMSELRRRKWKEISFEELQREDDSQPVRAMPFAAQAPTPEATAESHQAMQLVARIVQEELTPRQRAVMTAVISQGVPLDVLAERLGTNRNALYKTMHDARLKLKRRLEREGLLIADLFALVRR